MNPIERTSSYSIADFRNASIRFRDFQDLAETRVTAIEPNKPSLNSLLQVHQLREALASLRPGRLLNSISNISSKPAIAISNPPLDFSSDGVAQIKSVEEINTAPTSFQHNGPSWTGSTETAPWSGLGSTASATVGGMYDGTNGQGTLKFLVNRDGTHGEDDLRIKVYDDQGDFIQSINIDKEDPTNKVYELNNGLTVTLGAGDLVKNDYFEVDTSILSTSYTPNDPGWTGSSATPSIGGSYNGDQGTGDLTFKVTRQGEHGKTDLKITVFAPDDSVVETITVRKKDAIDKVYSLSNGLTFSLGEGELVKNETFTVAVDAGDSGNYTTDPTWNFGTATASFTGTYDGSNGTGTMIFRALDSGIHGEDDIRVRVYDTDGSTLETIDIDASDPIDQGYVLSNGLTVTFSNGDFIKNEEFTIDVEMSGSFSTDPNPVESTAEPALSGIYDGSLGTDVLEFKVVQAGEHGTDDLMFEVRTSDGTLIETINVLATDAENQVYELSTGLNFTLGAGSLALNETFTVGVSHLVPTSVDPDLSFDGTGLNDAKLEDQFTVVDGSFEINGNTIQVFANDSINSVLDRINNAGINVTASFDAATETIVMTRNTPGSENSIVLSNDTSGFLAATKLENAAVVLPSGDETSPLSDLDFMSGVTSGNIVVNGVSIAIDVDEDSLEDVLARIDSMTPDVEADFDADTGLVSISASNTEDLTISSGETGLFAALGINDGVYKAVQGSSSSKNRGFSFQTRRDTMRAIKTFTKRFNAVFEDKYGAKADPFIQEMRQELKTAITEIFAPGNSEASDFGMKFDFDKDTAPLRISESMSGEFAKNLRTTKGAKAFNAMFFGDEESDGLVDRMADLVRSAELELSIELAGSGSLVDVWA